MTLTYNIVFTIAGIFLILFSVVTLILTAPGAKRPKQGSAK